MIWQSTWWLIQIGGAEGGFRPVLFLFMFFSVGFLGGDESTLSTSGVAVLKNVFRPLLREFFGAALIAGCATLSKTQPAGRENVRLVRVGIAAIKGGMGETPDTNAPTVRREAKAEDCASVL
jgi:hypothetical protein